MQLLMALMLALGGCEEPTELFDEDNDGYAAGFDCDDHNALTYPEAKEICDGEDNDCDGDTDEGVQKKLFFDGDSDGFGDHNQPLNGCGATENLSANSADCDDNDSTVYPGAPELCDGKDNDCDVYEDENVTITAFVDSDHDGFGSVAVQVCEITVGYSDVGGDCNDNNDEIYPGAPESCLDNIDSDCDQSKDDEDAIDALAWYEDADHDGFGDPYSVLMACFAPKGHVDNYGDCDPYDGTIFPNAPQICDGKANNCNEPLPADEYDDDNDSYMGCDNDCDDSDDATYPGAVELCDGLINNCNNYSLPAEELDFDDDGYVLCEYKKKQWLGDSSVIGGEDCDDIMEQRYPDSEEFCDGVDSDCDGQIDPEEVDDDQDHYVVCTLDGAWVGAGTVWGGDDCDDSDIDVYPGAPDECDGVFTNCDLGALVDDEIDDDGDFYVECEITGAWLGDKDVVGGDDCDDQLAEVNPKAEDVCDGVDTDCDGVWSTDEQDNDGDLHIECEKTAWVGDPDIVAGIDCDDNNQVRYAGAVEQCNGLIDNCDDLADPLPDDESDLDADKWVECEIDDWLGATIDGGGDCNDDDDTVYPGAQEVCDGQKNNCDVDMPETEEDGDGDHYVECEWDAGGWDGDESIVGGLDCSPLDDGVYPAAPELCDGLHTDCNLPSIPEDELDQDNGVGDGWVACEIDDGGWFGMFQPQGGGDCDATNQNIHPGADEHCDGIDEDCVDGPDNDPVEQITLYGDGDKDGYGLSVPTMTGCIPEEGWAYTADDCDDLDPDEHPGQVWYWDTDGDGYGAGQGTESCVRPSEDDEWVIFGNDCADGNMSINPGKVEICFDNGAAEGV
ncbi:MAG: hypothetical protein HN348_11670, partial [Proteobacteria bacterium]|nr:hypothetical protein [Pseudomonadota bacterium]